MVLILYVSSVSLWLDSGYSFSVGILCRWWCLHSIVSGGKWCLLVMLILITWSSSCPISPLCSYFLFFKSLATNKQPVGRNFKTMQISCQSSLFPLWSGVCWSFLPDLIFTMMVAKWWSSNSSTTSTFTSRPSVFLCAQVFWLSPHLFIIIGMDSLIPAHSLLIFFGGFLSIFIRDWSVVCFTCDVFVWFATRVILAS